MASIHAYIALDKPLAAAKWERAIRRQWRSLRLNPRRYEVIPEVAYCEYEYEYRHVLYGNYRTIYRIADDKTVRVVRVIHAAQVFAPGS